MYSPVLSIPARRASAWVAETDPRYARAWLSALPLADSAESAREIYQALYTINRVELRAPVRLELMAPYDQAVAVVCGGLASPLALAVPPLPPKKRQLAEFIRRLHVEMAYGYKCCLRDLSRARLSLRRKARAAASIERALYHLGEVLLRSYQVYLPYPVGVWRELHELYRVADRLGAAAQPLEVPEQGVPRQTTITERYVRSLLLGLMNPYQLPQSAAQQAHAFLAHWAAQARIVPLPAVEELGDGTGCFIVDASADAPPVPLTRGAPAAGADVRLLDTRALLETVRGAIARLQAGEPIERLGLGVDFLDSACVDLLTRMVRAWGETARRRYARRARSSNLFVCVGLDALHFYVCGQRRFAAYLEACVDHARPRTVDISTVAFVDLDADEAPPGPGSAAAAPADSGAERYAVDRWRLRDIGPQGMSVARYGDAATPTRVGELVGVQQPSDFGRWRAAVVRWVKAPEANSIEAGVELLAASVAPAALRLPDKGRAAANPIPALRLPATELTHRPATLLLPRGVCHVGDELELLDEEGAPQRIRLLRLLERTGSFEQMVYGELIDGLLRPRRPGR